MSEQAKPAASLFAGLFSAPQSAKANAEYRRALEEAARELASWDETISGTVQLIQHFGSPSFRVRCRFIARLGDEED